MIQKKIRILSRKLTFSKKRLKLELQQKKFNRPIIKNKCLITSNSRSLFTFFGLGRHAIKKLSYLKQLPGIHKSTW